MTFYDSDDYSDYYDSNDLYDDWLDSQPVPLRHRNVVLSDGSVWDIELWKSPQGELYTLRRQRKDDCNIGPDMIPF